MTDRFSNPGDLCRCELLQLAFDGLAWPDLSVERLLDRVAESGEPGPADMRDPGPQNRTERCSAPY
jgi:hypothetical protein